MKNLQQNIFVNIFAGKHDRMDILNEFIRKISSSTSKIEDSWQDFALVDKYDRTPSDMFG